MAEFGLSLNGFNRKRLADIKAEKETAFKVVFGENINLNPQSNFGQIIGIESESEAIVWELAEFVYNAFYPSTAQGVQLSNLVALNGIQRKEATKSKVTLTLTGVDGTVVPAGSLVAIPNNTEQLSTDLDVTISSGIATVNATAVNEGPIIALAGSITQIDTPVFGWQSVTNLADATEGTNEETDAELRDRRSKSTQAAGQNLVDSLFGQLSNIDNVTSARVISNGTGVTDTNGIPAHQFLSIVQGGINSEIANIVWLNTPQGILSHGDIIETIIDSQGFPQDIKFSRPIAKDIYFAITVTTDSNYPGSGDGDIADNIVSYGDSNFKIGEDVILSQFYTPINSVPGVVSIDLKIGFSSNPTGTANLTIAFNEISNYDLSFITVTSS